MLQIGLTRETVTLEPGDHSLSAVRELVCSIVDKKVNLNDFALIMRFYFSCHRNSTNVFRLLPKMRKKKLEKFPS